MKLESFYEQCARIGLETARARGLRPGELRREELQALAPAVCAAVEAWCLGHLHSRQGTAAGAAAALEALGLPRQEAEAAIQEVMGRGE